MTHKTLRWIALAAVLLVIAGAFVSTCNAQVLKAVFPAVSAPAAAGGMTTVVDTVKADSSNATFFLDGAWYEYYTGVNLAVGEGAYNRHFGVIFTATVPKDATIDTAYLYTVGGGGNWSDADSAWVKIYNVDNVPGFNGTHTHSAAGHSTLGTDSIRWVGDLGYDVGVRSPNLKTLVQGVVNRAGWASGQRMGFVVSTVEADTKYRYIKSFNIDPANTVSLRIVYH